VLLLELGEDPAWSCASQPWATASRVGSACPAFWASPDAAARTCGFAYWSTTCPLAESSTMTAKYGRPVRSTESTASESMKTASSTRTIRSAARPIL
jgi:hypothetical protein